MRNATRLMTSACGGLVGLAGLEHGIGEILQGWVGPGGTVILSWPGSVFFRSLGGEPAMTIVPNLLVTGILAILFSLLYVAWATVLVERKHSGLALILLSVVMLLVGGGFGPPILGIIIGAAATRIEAPLGWWRARLSSGLRHLLGGLWPWFLGACLIAWLAMFPGVALLGYFFGLNDSNLVMALALCMLGSLLLTIMAGFAHDAQIDTGSLPAA